MFNFFKLKPSTMGLALVAALIGTVSKADAEIVVMGGNPEGSLFYAQSQALGAIIGQHTDIRVDVLPQSPTVYFPMFMTQEASIGLSSPIEADFAVRAKGPYEGVNDGEGYPITTLMLGSPIRLSLVVRANAGIDTISDLKGKRVVANYGAFAGSSITAEAVLANGGLTTDDVELVSASSYPEGVSAVIEGRADAAVGSMGSGILQQLNAAEGAKLLSVDPSEEAMARSREIGSAFVPLKVKAGPVGVDEDIHVLSYATTLYARSDLEDETVTTILQAIWDHHEELEAIHPSLATWTPDRFASEQTVVPYHPAAVTFYKDQDAWTDEVEARNNEVAGE
ncbi:TAXI family TRAP transporter solute-binding subunit [Mesorhizobium xinjiangense]|uniref:TAXI family TRAP transporter solute-binding subunit n=1 Tax=Mesorhizobium xinjiangense TaxID=2678685 RepID=UPI0012ED9A9C|nr:TAXI family TRAP transporter solute-binding subunit [Mesorhizobium xinjiangense]